MSIPAQYIPDPETEAYANSPEGLRSSARELREWAAQLIQFAENKEAEANEIEAAKDG